MGLASAAVMRIATFLISRRTFATTDKPELDLASSGNTTTLQRLPTALGKNR
jgi:hypothetical protein